MENFLVPMGILQIPVENALVHGLRNKEEGPKDLWINMLQGDENRIIFTITDNGIGRKAAALISNCRRNGERQRVNLDTIVAIVQCPENPRNKLVYLHQKSAPLACTLTWQEAASYFERGGQQAFGINKRYALIGKKFIHRYQVPYVWVGNPPLKLEVVKENIKAFEQWLLEG